MEHRRGRRPERSSDRNRCGGLAAQSRDQGHDQPRPDYRLPARGGVRLSDRPGLSPVSLLGWHRSLYSRADCSARRDDVAGRGVDRTRQGSEHAYRWKRSSPPTHIVASWSNRCWRFWNAASQIPIPASEEDAQLFCYALYLMAKWRETRRVPSCGSMAVFARCCLYASVGRCVDTGRCSDSGCCLRWRPRADQATGPESRRRRVFTRYCCRCARVALGMGRGPARHHLEHFTWLAREGLERQTSYAWSALAAESADIEALAVFPELRRAYDEGLIDPQTIGRTELDDVEASPRGDLLERMKDRYPPIDDIPGATSWWARFGKRASSRRAEELASLATVGDFDRRPGGAISGASESRTQRAVPLWQRKKVQEVLRPVNLVRTVGPEMLGTPQSECRTLGLNFAFEFTRKTCDSRRKHGVGERQGCHLSRRRSRVRASSTPPFTP